MDSREIKVLRRQTTRFIADNPTMIAFTRPGARVSDGAGGWTTGNDTPIDPQKVRLIIQPRAGLSTQNIDGEKINPVYVMIAEWDADITLNDVFMHEGRDYKIEFVREDRRYETWAEVSYHG